MPFKTTARIACPHGHFEEGQAISQAGNNIPKPTFASWLKSGLVVQGKGSKPSDPIEEEDEVEDLLDDNDDFDMDNEVEAPAPAPAPRRKAATRKK